MKAKKAFAIVGKKIEKRIKKFHFKYSIKYKYLRKSTKKYDYYILFSSFFENIPDKYIDLHIIFVINDRILLRTNMRSNSQLFMLDLWELGNHYNIADETLINNAVMDLNNKIEEYLIPHIKKLEGTNKKDFIWILFKKLKMVLPRFFGKVLPPH